MNYNRLRHSKLNLNVLLFAFTMLMFCQCYSQKVKRESYSVINSFFKNPALSSINLSAEFVPFENYSMYSFEKIINRDFLRRSSSFMEINIDTLLFDKDYAFMKEQKEQLKGKIKIDKIFFLNARINIVDSIRTKEQKFSSNNRMHMLSVPLFSKDMKKAVMYVETYCGEDGCSNGVVYILRKEEKGEWEILGSISAWLE